MERSKPKDKTLVRAGARTLGSFKPGDVVDVTLKGSRETIYDVVVLSIAEVQKGNSSVVVGIPLDSPYGFMDEYENIALGGGTAAAPAEIKYLSDPDQRPYFKGTYHDDGAVKAKYLEVGTRGTVFTDSGSVIDGTVIGVKESKQPNNPSIRLKDLDGKVLYIGGGTAVIPRKDFSQYR